MDEFNIEKMKKQELLDYAEERGIDVSEDYTKAEIIRAIDLQEADTANIVTPGPPPEPPKTNENREKFIESQNNDVKVLTTSELFAIIAKVKGSNPYKKFALIKQFAELNPDFQFPSQSRISQLIYLQNVAHYEQNKDTLT